LKWINIVENEIEINYKDILNRKMHTNVGNNKHQKKPITHCTDDVSADATTRMPRHVFCDGAASQRLWSRSSYWQTQGSHVGSSLHSELTFLSSCQSNCTEQNEGIP